MTKFGQNVIYTPFSQAKRKSGGITQMGGFLDFLRARHHPERARMRGRVLTGAVLTVVGLTMLVGTSMAAEAKTKEPCTLSASAVSTKTSTFLREINTYGTGTISCKSRSSGTVHAQIQQKNDYGGGVVDEDWFTETSSKSDHDSKGWSTKAKGSICNSHMKHDWTTLARVKVWAKYTNNGNTYKPKPVYSKTQRLKQCTDKNAKVAAPTTTLAPTPATEPPVTEPPVTEPPVTEPPATEPPATAPPQQSGGVDTGGDAVTGG